MSISQARFPVPAPSARPTGALPAAGDERPVAVKPASARRNPGPMASFVVITRGSDDPQSGAAHAQVVFSGRAVELFPQLGTPVKGLRVAKDHKSVSVDKDWEMDSGHRTEIGGLDADKATEVAKVLADFNQKAKSGEYVYGTYLRPVPGGVDCINFTEAVMCAATGTSTRGDASIMELRQHALDLQEKHPAEPAGPQPRSKL